MEFALKILEIIAGLAFAGGGIFLFLAAQKRQGVAAAKDQLIGNLEKDRDSWKSRYELEHIEIQKYRDEVHEKSDQSHREIIRLTSDNEQLRVRTDLSPLMEMIKKFIVEQSEINKQIISAIELLANPRRARRKEKLRKAPRL